MTATLTYTSDRTDPVEAIFSTGFLAGVGGGGLVVITRSGTVFAGPQLNLGTGGVSIAGRAGYLIQPGPFWAASDGQDVDSAIAGWSFSGSVTNWPGYSRSVVIGLNGDTVPTGLSGAVSVEVGVGTSGPFPVTYSMSASYLFTVAQFESVAW